MYIFDQKDSLTKNYIFEAFFDLLSKQSINEINISSVCNKAGVSRMSFYRNFKSKDDLITKSLERILQNLKNNLAEYSHLNQYIVTKEIFSISLKYNKITKAFKNTDYMNKFLDSISDKIFSFAPEDKINPTKRYIPIFYFSALAGVLNFWINNNSQETPEEMARCICSIAKFPIFSEENIHIN